MPIRLSVAHSYKHLNSLQRSPRDSSFVDGHYLVLLTSVGNVRNCFVI
jgi:hypothetical protein